MFSKRWNDSNLVDDEGVLLLVGGVLHALAELVELAEVFLPQLVDGDNHEGLVPLLDYGAAFGFESLAEVAAEVEHALAVGDGHHNETVIVGVCLSHGAEHGERHLAYSCVLAVEGLNGGLVEGVDAFLGRHILVFLGREWSLDGKETEDFGAEVVVVGGAVVGADEVLDGVVDHVRHVDAYAFAEDGVAAALIDVGALLVHHVVELEEALADAVVVLLERGAEPSRWRC